ncbi:hypothetical protein L1987_79087 [Smallanthus sonchifolius]|uniref:Uncharacterized protein n=1 Tax=Smallanthus sonchifolius TaxID=185202 RepID=A0ACB8ZFI8_9ASTR|nr:hypothetical protein L1987_79087 [Smallanthus sonchifolius]
MGRSTSSCFKIISCGCINESVDRDEIPVSSENKGRDKPGWSFRKKSARHQVPSNAVVIEKIPSAESKEIPEPITICSEPQFNSKNISEKTSDNIWTEEIPNSIAKNETVSTTTKPACEEDGIKCEPVPDESESESESAVLVIQAAVRRFLAERRLVKHKNVVKLQAAVRGHLVRNHAVGTLRCVQAIVKMQTLVRARREKVAQNAGINSTPTHISIEKLLSNKLARQLLESTPKTKQINIKCDPSKADSTWNWLERWMSVSSPETLESHTPDHEQDKVVNNMENEVKMVISSNNVGEATVRFEEKEKLIEESSNVKTHVEEPIPESMVIPVSDTKPIPIPENHESETIPKPIPENPVSETKPKSIPENSVSETKTILIPENPVSETKPKPIPENPVSETKPILIPENPVSETKPKPIPENPVSETAPKPDSEGSKYVFGSRKASNPAFVAAQSRFEELTSSKTNLLDSSNQDDEPSSGSGSSSPADNGSSHLLKSAKFSNQDDVAGSGSGSGSGSPADIGSSDLLKPDNEVSSCADIGSSTPGKAALGTDVDPVAHLVTHGSQVVKNGGSECGTELSITSTLDSPDQFEIEDKKLEEPKVLNEEVDDMNTSIDDDNNNNDNKIDIVMPETQVDQKPEHVDHEPVIQLSTSGSPSSHITTLESQGTPSSQASTTPKKTKTDKKVSGQSQNRKSWSNSKKSSPVRSSVDSSLRSSLEEFPKDPKPVKRRNSSGSPRPGHIDHEPSVPSYMHATESARAKAVANSSPRLSPDVHDKETYLKKRRSLPGAVNSRQGSPHIQRSMSQALQTTKGNGNQERKWQR